MIQTNDITKSFGNKLAVRNLSLNIKKGEIYGFLGPNGAGKTTTIRMLLGLSTPDSGTIRINGIRVTQKDNTYKANIGVVPEKHPYGIWKWMNGKEYLRLFCDLYDVKNYNKRISDLLEKMELSEHRNKPICQYSKGMMQKLSFARAIIHDPDILLLDEPISGLDPFGIRQMRDLILEQNKNGKTIFVSSHLLAEIEKFCTRIGIIYNGELIKEDSTKNIIDSIGYLKTYRIEFEQSPLFLQEKLLGLKFVSSVTIEKNILWVSVDKAGDYRKHLSNFFFENELPPLLIQEDIKTLEEAFLSITTQKKSITREEQHDKS